VRRPRHLSAFARRASATKPAKKWDGAWRSLRDAAGLPGFRFHDLRHTVVTDLLEAAGVLRQPIHNRSLRSVWSDAAARLSENLSTYFGDVKREEGESDTQCRTLEGLCRFTAASISVAAKACLALVGVVKFMPCLLLSARSMVDYKRKSAFAERDQRPVRRLGDVREWRVTVAAGKPVTLIVPSGRPRHPARSLTGVGPAIRTL
jgi:hypothetical protein